MYNITQDIQHILMAIKLFYHGSHVFIMPTILSYRGTNKPSVMKPYFRKAWFFIPNPHIEENIRKICMVNLILVRCQCVSKIFLQT